jgi:hypothetical protein
MACTGEKKKAPVAGIVQASPSLSQFRAAPDTDRPGPDAGKLVGDVVGSAGERLDPGTRAFMESRLGGDFSEVRIHRGAAATASARAIDAVAYTSGSHIVFADARYSPDSPSGRQTLAHELSHVLQQSHGPVDGTDTFGGVQVSHPDDRFEREARRIATSVVTGAAPVRPNARPAGQAARADRTPNRPAVPVQRDAAAVTAAAGVAVSAGAAYVAWAMDCLSPLQAPMLSETTTRFLPKYYADTKKPVPNRVWDAFGHCWIGCAGTEKCGSTTTAIAGKAHELWREYAPAWLGNPPHDSYEQDTNNQATGRAFGEKKVDCFTACDNAARTGGLDLTAPEAKCYDGSLPPYPAPCGTGRPAAPAAPAATPGAPTTPPAAQPPAGQPAKP